MSTDTITMYEAAMAAVAAAVAVKDRTDALYRSADAIYQDTCLEKDSAFAALTAAALDAQTADAIHDAALTLLNAAQIPYDDFMGL
jgi:hypothetical protein